MIEFSIDRLNDLIENEANGNVAIFAEKMRDHPQKYYSMRKYGTKPAMETLEAICNCYDVEPGYFFVENNVRRGNVNVK
jgi:replication initiation and membrane attachment protein DnaB